MTDRLSSLLHEVDQLDVGLPGPAGARARGRSIRRRRAAAGGAGALAVLGVAGALFLTPGGEPPLEQVPAVPGPSAAASPEPTSSASPSASTAPPAPVVTSPSPGRGEDSRETGYLTRVEQTDDGWVVGVDRVQVLTGDAADARAAATGQETPVPNDSLIVNDNPLVRTYPVADDVVVTLTIPLSGSNVTDPLPGDMQRLQRGLAAVPYRGTIPFEVTVRDGVVTRIEQQYRP